MTEKRQLVKIEALSLREQCVEAHNRLLRDARYSSLGRLIRSLAPEIEPGSDSPELRILSSYTFWGSRDLGGARRGFEKRFDRIADAAYRQLFREFKKSPFAAWECVEVGEPAEKDSTWRSVGRRPELTEEFELVFDGRCEEIEPKVGDVRAGWMIEELGVTTLAYATPIPASGAARLAETATEEGWNDEDADEGEEFQAVEYERDVLTQTVCPDWETCGLGEYYYLPADQRTTFPDEFRRHMIRAMVKHLDSRRAPWHVRLARANEVWIEEQIRQELDALRRDAATSAGRYRGDRIDFSVLDRLLSDGECLELLGLTPEGGVDLDEFPPTATHPVDLLGLDEEWFDKTGANPRSSIQRIRRGLGDCDEEHAREFEGAVEEHEARLRWTRIMEHIVEIQDLNQWVLSPRYRYLRKTAELLFDPMVTELTVEQLLVGRGRGASRIVTALENAEEGDEPVFVDDLPMRERSLLAIGGIGPASAQSVTTALLETMMEWPPELARRIDEVDDEARDEIEAGLDALDELF